ncbi:hypothetical protein HRI_004864200 [Hibiscus trionum]|uniref:Uncharacterized protein n=1 Tax=Hibiscus trionum TaxID=183268 RepID=A0A9W7MR99_HIBTR|nr:hypothetical protein HRI_004864200 [Hibiscus trionum]
MGVKKNTYFDVNQEEFEKTLSFCDLSIEYQNIDNQSLAFHHSPKFSSHDHEGFEFPLISNTPLENNKANDIVFCGKRIEEHDFVVDNRDQSKHIFSLPSVKQFNHKKKDLVKSDSSLSTKSFKSQKSFSVKQYKSLIGITKIQPKIELSDLKKRQNKRDYPLPMFPPVAINVDVDDGCGGTSLGCITHV